MTDAQKTALDSIEGLMREHFVAGVVVVEGEMPGCDNASDIETVYHGGYAASIGLMELGKLYVWRHGRDQEGRDE